MRWAQRRPRASCKRSRTARFWATASTPFPSPDRRRGEHSPHPTQPTAGPAPDLHLPCPGGATPGARRPAVAGSALGRDRAEQPVGLVVDAGGEVQSVRVAVQAGVAELERPEPVDRELAVPRGVERAAVLELAVPHLPVGVDLPVAEVADQQIAAEATERRRRPGDPPRGVELPVPGDATEELPVEVVDVHDPEPTAVRLVVRSTLLLRVGHEDPVVDRLDPERSVVLRELAVDERTGRV